MKINLPIYRFKKENLEYSRITLTGKILLKTLLIQTIITTMLMIILSIFFNTPKEVKLLKELEALKQEFLIVDKKTTDVQYLLDVLEKKDSIIYQSLFTTSDTIIDETYEYTNYHGVFGDTIANVKSHLSNIEIRLKKINYRFKNLIVEIDKNNVKLRHTPAIQPISNRDLARTSSGFGVRIHPIYNVMKMHYGMDFVAPVGTPVYATADGEIEITSNSFYGYGKYIKIKHNDNYQTAYGHLDKIFVKKGESVKRGDVIGTIGDTGLSTGPHLHYEVISNGRHVDPINYYFHDLTVDQYERMIQISRSITKSLD